MKKIVFFFSHIMLVGLMVSVMLTSCSKDEYTITVIAGENGTAQVDVVKAVAGTNIVISAKADENYVFDKWTVTAGGATLVDPTEATTSFTMPMADVTIQAEFVSGKIEILTALHLDENKRYSILAMLPDGSDKRYIFRGDGVIQPTQGSIGSDGKTLVMGCNDDTGVRTYDLSTHTLSVLTGVGDYEGPVFSPDMKKVFVSNFTKNEFISIDVATKAVTVLDSENNLACPSFKDDQTMIVTYSWGKSWSIASIKTDGTNLVILKEAPGQFSHEDPFFIKALNKIVYIKGYIDTYKVCMMNSDGSGEVILTPENVNYSSPSVSKDGKVIAFVNVDNEIFVASLNGYVLENKRAITTLNDMIRNPRFCEINKDIFESLPKYVAPAVGPK